MTKDQLLLHVRSIQNYAAIIAEIFILLALAMSGMDISLGGTMASIPFLKWSWAAVLALGVDVSFIVSWVRCRQYVKQGRPRALWWSVPLAMCMSFIVFQPTAVQMLQQSLNLGFEQALNSLGINLEMVVYARAFVAVFLGAVLALTNVENDQDVRASNTTEREMVSVELPIEQQPIEHVHYPPFSAPVAIPAKEDQVEQIEIEQSTRLKVVERNTEEREEDLLDQTLRQYPHLSNREISRRTGKAVSTVCLHRKKLSNSEQAV